MHPKLEHTEDILTKLVSFPILGGDSNLDIIEYIKELLRAHQIEYHLVPNEDGHKTGSKWWLLDQARNTQDTLNYAIDHAKKALQWLIDDKHCKDIQVSGSLTVSNIIIVIKFIRNDNQVINKSYKLWEESSFK
jgi:hypothetical protein